MTDEKMRADKIPLLVIAGPTASGKTALSVELAKRLEGEIICADSMQIYDEIYIGTARVTQEEMQGVRHHLCGFLPLSESYSAAQFVDAASKAAEDIFKRGKLPIICGGTGLYISSLINNVKFSEAEPDEKLRASLMEKDNGELLEELKRVDPESGEKLHISDKKRIVRALEIYYSTGKTITEHNRLSMLTPSRFDVCFLGLSFADRDILYGRIEKRVDIMLKKGLIDEAKRVMESKNAGTVRQAIGYKEFLPYFNGECTLDKAVANLKQNTRHYAKRQLTWFRRDERVNWIFSDEYNCFNDVINRAEEILMERWKCKNGKIDYQQFQNKNEYI